MSQIISNQPQDHIDLQTSLSIVETFMRAVLMTQERLHHSIDSMNAAQGMASEAEEDQFLDVYVTGMREVSDSVDSPVAILDVFRSASQAFVRLAEKMDVPLEANSALSSAVGTVEEMMGLDIQTLEYDWNSLFPKQCSTKDHPPVDGEFAADLASLSMVVSETYASFEKDLMEVLFVNLAFVRDDLQNNIHTSASALYNGHNLG